MFKLHLARNLRSFGFLAVLIAVILGVAGLWWANQTGLPESWRAAIESAARARGLHMRIGALQVVPFKGIVAARTHFYADAGRTRRAAYADKLTLSFDLTKLARGQVSLNQAELAGGDITLSARPEESDSEVIQIHKARGVIAFGKEKTITIQKARGLVAGIDVTVDAKFIGYREDPDAKPDPEAEVRRRELVARIARILEDWDYEAAEPPRLHVIMEGDLNDHASIRGNIALHAPVLSRLGHSLTDLSAAAELGSDFLALHTFNARDERGAVEAEGYLTLSSGKARFRLQSTLDVPKLTERWFGQKPLPVVVLGGAQEFDVQGSFTMTSGRIGGLAAKGHVLCEAVMVRGVRFDQVSSAFSYRDQEMFLRDLELSHPQGEARGKAMIQWPLVRLALDSTLPCQVYQPFFRGQPLEEVIADFTNGPEARYDISLEGGFDARDKYSWAYTGSGTLTDVAYKGVPVRSAQCKFTTNTHELDFHSGTVVFDYRDYPIRKTFGGPDEATVKVGRIRYVGDGKKIVEVEQVRGAIWAAPLVRFFAPKLADSLEVYRFHRPPDLSGDGIVDVTPQGRTKLDVTFRSEQAVNYGFLGSDVTFEEAAGAVRLRGKSVHIEGLKLAAFDGGLRGDLKHDGAGVLSGEVDWTKIKLPGLASAYGFKTKGGGSLTGRIEFQVKGGDIGTMEGRGLVGLAGADLFSVPLFGPLSPIMGSVLGERASGIEHAKEAFMNFRIKDGVMSTYDFQTGTPSVTLVGDGSVDMKTKQLDMTLRMNARGLFGLITLPLRPFYGLFQFRGSGELKQPEWENVMFTSPPKELNDLLMTPPKARVIPE